MKTQRSADIASGIFLAVLGIVVLIAGMGIKGGMEERLPPRTLPYAMGFTILVTGVMLAVKAWRWKGENPDIKWPDRAGKLRVVIHLVALTAYIFLVDPVGMPIATVLFVSFSVWHLKQGGRRILYGAVTGILSGLVVYYLFIRFLELTFPLGPLAW